MNVSTFTVSLHVTDMYLLVGRMVFMSVFLSVCHKKNQEIYVHIQRSHQSTCLISYFSWKQNIAEPDDQMKMNRRNCSASPGAMD